MTLGGELFERLEELRDVVGVLYGDVERLRPVLGSRSISDAVSEEEYGYRRAYVREIFALVEAIVEQHKLLLLDLTRHEFIKLDPLTVSALSEQGPSVSDAGAVAARDVYLQLRRKVRLVYRVAADACGQSLVVRYDDEGWRQFGAALSVRDRITHPKSYLECHIEGEELDKVDAGQEWFKALANEFVRVSQAHRKEERW
jgi:hypothetical protein